MAVAGEPRYRARQVFRWLHAAASANPAEMSNLPRPLRARLAEESLEIESEILTVRRATDGTRKALLRLAGGAQIECVVIPMKPLAESSSDADLAVVPEDDDAPVAGAPTRVTVCLSTQHGCAMGCVFCASGRSGLFRGLSAAEIIEQVRVARAQLEPGEVLRNLVFMGMGEPLHHYDETARALRVLTHADGMDLSLRRITVSTVGLVPGIDRLGEDFGGKVGLAVSLHAPTDELRNKIVPMNARYSVGDIMAALRRYPLPRRRRITLEYTLIRDVNDGDSEARELVRLVRGLKVKVNLIPMNPVAGSGLEASSRQRVLAFQEIVAGSGISCFVRVRRGDDVDAACGQLALGGEPVAPQLVRGIRRKTQ
jgi:23S rRNA (adenine2503-C2)-methyltransferase